MKEVDYLEYIENHKSIEVIKEQKNIHIKETMRQGYLEMSKVNRTLLEMGLRQDISELYIYETNLTGSGKQ